MRSKLCSSSCFFEPMHPNLLQSLFQFVQKIHPLHQESQLHGSRKVLLISFEPTLLLGKEFRQLMQSLLCLMHLQQHHFRIQQQLLAPKLLQLLVRLQFHPLALLQLLIRLLCHSLAPLLEQFPHLQHSFLQLVFRHYLQFKEFPLTLQELLILYLHQFQNQPARYQYLRFQYLQSQLQKVMGLGPLLFPLKAFQIMPCDY